MKTKKRKCLVMLIAMLVPMTSVALTGCNGKNEVSKATPDQATALITTQQVNYTGTNRTNGCRNYTSTKN